MSRLGDRRVRRDRFHQQAKRDGFRARAVYKLGEIDDQFKLLAHGDRVLDLGCAPGSWLQHAASKVGAPAAGALVGIDRTMIPLIFQKEIYATACLLGSLVFIGMRELGTPHWLDTGVAMLCVLLARLAAIRWHLALPRFHLLNRD